MSLKLMLNCGGAIALHPTFNVPVLMESPCPFTPWTWERTYIQFPDEAPTVTSTNPGMTLALSWTTAYNWSTQNVTYVGKVLWDCTKSGLSVTAALTGDNTASMLVWVNTQLGHPRYISLNETDGLGPKYFAAESLYLRFSIRVYVTLRRATPGTATATLNFAWTT